MPPCGAPAGGRRLNPVDAKQAVQVDDDAFFLNAGPTAARLVMTTVTDTLSKKK